MNQLDKQYTDLLGDAYKRYYTEWRKSTPGDGTFSSNEYSSPSKYEACNFTKEEFIKQIKTDDEFAKKWGVMVEIRELSYDQRFEIFILKNERKFDWTPDKRITSDVLDELTIPKRAISFTYNNQTIEIYES
jgi:hypothetical protein